MRQIGFIAAMVVTGAGMATAAHAQVQPCTAPSGRTQVEVVDTLGAAIARAAVTLDGTPAGLTDNGGRFLSPGLPAGPHHLEVQASDFNPRTASIQAGTRLLRLTLKPLTVETSVDAITEDAVSTSSVAGTRELTGDEIKQLADDPDELARQLQVLAAAAGGAPGQAIVAVDGFQNSSRIPPKSAIALIRVNPDLFSSEYERPPYQGGRIEIVTRPGTGKLHGALFTTQSASWLNAKDPFAPSKAAIGRQRYGFELGGPIRANREDFFLSLEHRQINQFAVVNAVTLDSAGNAQPVTANVPTPQSLWEGSARLGAMLTPRNNVTATYTATANALQNLGVGGTSLPETGYNSQQSEHSLRITDLQTLSASLLHESRLGLTWRRRDDTPISTAPQLTVAGAFTAGGAPTQALRSHELDTEFDDDLLWQHHKHSIKAGLQLLDIQLQDALPTNFNGAYTFGGGAAPVLTPAGTPTGATTVITGLEQYRRALAGLPGGNPTQYAVTTVNPALALNQLRVVLFAQDQWKLRPRLELSFGLRYALQSAPLTVANLAPRVGLAWSTDHKQRWVVHLRTGLFYTPVSSQTTLEALRLNGSNQSQLQVSNPVYQPASGSQPGSGPIQTGTAQVTTLRAPLPGLTQTPSAQTHLGLEHDFPQHWHAQVNLYLARAWGDLRSRNINAPLNGQPSGQPSGPRPGTPGLNLYQFQQTGALGGNVLFAGVDQHSYKKLQLFAGYIHMDLHTNADTDTLFPQSTYSDAGEYARPTWQASHQFIAFANLLLPLKLSLSTQFNAASGNPYNITDGFDSNGDGIFNDRPRHANPGDSNVVSTAFGPLSTTGTGAVLQRDLATLPWNIHLDGNLVRTFKLGHDAQTLAVNLRSTNLLNHSNATAAGGVLGSPLFGVVYAADPGRRIEVGLRYAF